MRAFGILVLSDAMHNLEQETPVSLERNPYSRSDPTQKHVCAVEGAAKHAIFCTSALYPSAGKHLLQLRLQLKFYFDQ